MKKNTSG